MPEALTHGVRFCIKMMKYLMKMMEFVLKMMNFGAAARCCRGDRLIAPVTLCSFASASPTAAAVRMPPPSPPHFTLLFAPCLLYFIPFCLNCCDLPREHFAAGSSDSDRMLCRWAQAATILTTAACHRRSSSCFPRRPRSLHSLVGPQTISVTLYSGTFLRNCL